MLQGNEKNILSIEQLCSTDICQIKQDVRRRMGGLREAIGIEKHLRLHWAGLVQRMDEEREWQIRGYIVEKEQTRYRDQDIRSAKDQDEGRRPRVI